jgi:hypothetical protein
MQCLLPLTALAALARIGGWVISSAISRYDTKHESLGRIPKGLIDDRCRMHKAVSGLLRKSLWFRNVQEL